MSDNLNLINSRRSIRKYSIEQVDRSLIEQIVCAGQNAPSARDQKILHFLVITDQETKQKIVDCCPNGSFLINAPVVILVLADLDLEKTPGYWSIDSSAAVENMLIAINALDLGGCWIGVHPRQEREAGLKEIFNLPENIRPHSLISFGYPDEEKDNNDNYDNSRIHFDKW